MLSLVYVDLLDPSTSIYFVKAEKKAGIQLVILAKIDTIFIYIITHRNNKQRQKEAARSFSSKSKTLKRVFVPIYPSRSRVVASVRGCQGLSDALEGRKEDQDRLTRLVREAVDMLLDKRPSLHFSEQQDDDVTLKRTSDTQLTQPTDKTDGNMDSYA